MIHIAAEASSFRYGDFIFCECLTLHVDNSVLATKPALTSSQRNETTPCTSVAALFRVGAKRLGFQMLAASSLKRGGLPGPPQLR